MLPQTYYTLTLKHQINYKRLRLRTHRFNMAIVNDQIFLQSAVFCGSEIVRL